MHSYYVPSVHRRSVAKSPDRVIDPSRAGCYTGGQYRLCCAGLPASGEQHGRSLLLGGVRRPELFFRLPASADDRNCSGSVTTCAAGGTSPLFASLPLYSSIL